MNFEETKKKYEDEIARLRAIMEKTQNDYQQAFNQLEGRKEKLLEEYNNKISTLNIGIERLRGAYTALCDMEEGKDPTLVVNGMMKETEQENVEQTEEPVVEENVEDTEKNVPNDISEEVKEKAHELVKEAKDKGLVTPYKEFAESELGKETAVKDVKEVVTEEKAEELAQLHQGGEAILSDAENEALNKVIEEAKKADKKEEPQTTVNPEEVPDYLKEEYGIK